MATKKNAVKETAQQNAQAQKPQSAKAGAFSPRLKKLHRGK